jgi:CheY-like chemotaxis protein
MLKSKAPLQRHALKRRVNEHTGRDPIASRKNTGPASIRSSVHKKRQDLDDGTSFRVLVVDSHAAILEVVAMMFKALGYRVSIAQDCQAAVASISSMPFDLVVSEFDMSTLNGCRLAAFVKDNLPTAKVLIMTGLCQSEVAAEMGSPHVDGWIFKPFGFEELLDAFESIKMPEACPCYPGLGRSRDRMTQPI